MKATLRILAMVTALVVVAGSGFILGTAHEKEVSAKLQKEMEWESDIRDFGTSYHYSKLLCSDDPSDSQESLEYTQTSLIRDWGRMKKLPKDHLYSKYLLANNVSIDPLVLRLEQRIAESQQDVPSNDDKPSN